MSTKIVANIARLIADMSHFMLVVQQSMHACRRAQSSPPDFLAAVRAHQLTLTSLLPHLDPPVPRQQSHVLLSLETAIENDVRRPFQSLDRALGLPTTMRPWIPHHFPQLPDEHTFKDTPQFLERENDLRKIREKATEEGRLAEEALRKVVNAGTVRSLDRTSALDRDRSSRRQRTQMWRDTMAATSNQNPVADIDVSRDHVSMGVNADRQFWRQPVK